ncbi:MAG TPA: flavohemoglobin expression-modulating QEGLA motif protein, partial [Gammaproteobacteria bacterium]|nr:flavohemoglobin expression-modulating QEGLA motif protein [Gammaproteobacteria bacterium]
MQKWSESDIIVNLEKGKTFEALSLDGSLAIKVEDYVPYLCVAIHHGHHLRPELTAKCLLTEAERLYEEDPYTGDFIASMPITLIAQDSRYEYDLNRTLEQCVYDIAWGKKVWNQALDANEHNQSREKHQGFYRILRTLIEQLERRFKACVLYDIHAYNYKRFETDTPTFNIGTTQVAQNKWENVIAHFLERLGKVELPNIEVRTAENEVFQGKGYLATFVKTHFTQTLVLPTEIKKIYLDENSGEIFPLVLTKLKEGMKNAILYNAAYFVRRYTNKRIT